MTRETLPRYRTPVSFLFRKVEQLLIQLPKRNQKDTAVWFDQPLARFSTSTCVVLHLVEMHSILLVRIPTWKWVWNV